MRRLLIFYIILSTPAARADFVHGRGGGSGGTPVASGVITITSAPYNAACDGVTDDSAAIQAAVTAGIATHQAVRIPPSANGCVIPTSGGAVQHITVSDSLTIFGDGPQSTVYIKGATWLTNSNRGYFDVNNPTSTISNISFQSFRFVGDYPFGTPGPSGGVGAIIFGTTPDLTKVVNNTTVDHMTFERLGGPGVQYNGGDNNFANCCQGMVNSVTHSAFLNSGSMNGQINPFTNGLGSTTVSGNTFQTIQSTALEWAGSEAIITDNVFDHVYSSAIILAGLSTQTGYTIIGHNTMRYVGLAIPGTTVNFPCIQLSEVAGSFRARIDNNSIQYCGSTGIVVYGATDMDITNNLVDCPGYLGLGRTGGTNPFTGLSVANGTNLRVTGNAVKACTGASDTSVNGILANGTAGTNSWADGNVVFGSFSGRAMLLNSSIAAGSYAGVSNFVGRNNINLTAGRYIQLSDGTNLETGPAFPDGATTPNVGGSDVWMISNSNPTTITNLLNGYPGQVLTLQVNYGLNTIQNNANIHLQGGHDRALTVGDTIQLVQNVNGGLSGWYEVPFRQSTSGTITLAAGTGTATVPSLSKCVCSDSTSAAAVRCSVSGTTLTATGTGTDVVVYYCF